MNNLGDDLSSMNAIRTTCRKIVNFLALPNGWNYGSGRPPLLSSIRSALDYLLVAQNLGITEADAFPGEDGEVLLRFYAGDLCASFTFEVDGSLGLILENKSEELLSFESATSEQANDVIAQVAETTCDSSASQIRVISMPDVVISSPWLSKSTQKTMPHPSFRNSVSQRQQVNIAPISRNSILLASPEPHLYSGFSTTPIYQPALR